MSIKSDITRITDHRNIIRQDFVDAGMATGNERISELAENMRNINYYVSKRVEEESQGNAVDIMKEDYVFTSNNIRPLAVSASSYYNNAYAPEAAINGVAKMGNGNSWGSVGTSAGGSQWWSADFVFDTTPVLAKIEKIDLITVDEPKRGLTLEIQKKNVNGQYETFYTYNHQANTYNITLNIENLSVDCYGIRVVQTLPNGGYVYLFEINIYGRLIEI